MPSSHLILCRPLLLLPPIPPSIRVFSNESTLRMRWPKYWSFSFSISPSNEPPRLISFRMDWLDLLAVQGTLKSLLQHYSSKASILQCSAFFTVQLSHPYMTTGKTIALTRQTLVGKIMSLLFNTHIGMIDASGGVLDQDYEMFEQQTPHRLIRHELLEDSAGAGQWRGGLGVETIFEIGSEDTQLVTFGDGDFEGAFGLAGGHGAGLNFIRLTYPDGTTVVPKNKDLITGVPKGTVYHQVANGGGGWGDPARRDRAKLAADRKSVV